MKKIILSYGLIYGLITAIMTILFQHGIIGMMLNGLASIPLLIIIMILAGKKYKADHDGYASFGDMFKLLMGVFVMASFISLVIMFIHAQLLSAESKETIIENTIEAQTSLFEQFMPEEVLTQMEDQMEIQSESMFEPMTLLMTFFTSLFGSLFFALIGSAIMKKNRPGGQVLDRT